MSVTPYTPNPADVQARRAAARLRARAAWDPPDADAFWAQQLLFAKQDRANREEFRSTGRYVGFFWGNADDVRAFAADSKRQNRRHSRRSRQRTLADQNSEPFEM